MPTTIALTRALSPRMVACELTHLAREPIDLDRAAAQHADYEALLRTLGCEVHRVAPAPEHPDAVFIEDTAVVVDEVAVLTRPGAESRRGEVEGVAAALAAFRPLVRLTAPATLDGGDVLTIGKRLYVGRTARTNDEGVAQLRAALAPHGYTVTAVPVTGCLHLKSAVTAVDDRTVLLNPEWVDPAVFGDYRVIAVDRGEPMGANILRVGDQLIYATAAPRTLARLEAAGVRPHTVDASELAKAEGAVTCCSVLFRVG